MTRELDFTKITFDFNSATKRLILLDYDGTLVPFHTHPHLAKPGAAVIDIVTELCADPKNYVAIISGRRRDDLEMFWESINVNLIAEHGGYYREVGKNWKRLFGVTPNWISQVRPALDALVFQHEGSFVEEKTYSIAWHYRTIPERINEIEKQQIIAALRNLPAYRNFIIYDGEFTLELRCPGIDKGSFVRHWLGSRTFDFIMALGDGDTDEDLFKALDNTAYTIKVGLHQTMANYFLRDQSDVITFLRQLIATHRQFLESMTRVGIQS